MVHRPSFCLSVTWVDQSKTVAVRIMKFSPYYSPIPSFFRVKFHPEIMTGSPERGRQTRVYGIRKTSHFMRQYFENGRRYVHIYIDD